MTRAVRLSVFVLAACALVVALMWSFAELAPVGGFSGPCGELFDRVALGERHATDVVSAINFDYRAFDTLGEEFILFASVGGVALLLRPSRRQALTPAQRNALEHLPGRQRLPTSDAVRLLALAMIGLDVLFGTYVVLHGQLSPGGGFQGGVILASAALLAYLGGDAPTLRRIAPAALVERAEGAGAAVFVGIGLLGMAIGHSFLQNVLPLGPGERPSILSGGTIPLVSLATGVEVAGGFVLLLRTFLQESLYRTSRRGRE